jgi:hypothetical protein
VVAGIQASGAGRVIADGPETAWALLKIYPALGLSVPQNVRIELLSEVLAGQGSPKKRSLGKAFFHDSRPACFLGTAMANALAVQPGYREDESAFGTGPVYEAPRRLLEKMGVEQVTGTWIRALSKTSGADDGLWLTYPNLADGLAAQRLEYAEYLGASVLVADSPLAASFLAKHAAGRGPQVKFLAELIA